MIAKERNGELFILERVKARVRRRWKIVHRLGRVADLDEAADALENEIAELESEARELELLPEPTGLDRKRLADVRDEIQRKIEVLDDVRGLLE
jgi:hypothetical protein